MVFTQATTYAPRNGSRVGTTPRSWRRSLTFSGYALAHWGHPQLQLMGMLPLGFLLLFRLLDAPTTRNAVLFGVVAAAIALERSTTGGLRRLRRRRPARTSLVAALPAEARVLGGIAISVAAAGVLVAPFAVGYARLQSQPGFERPSVPAWGLKAADFFTPAPRSYLYDWMARIGPERDGEHMHFLGFSVLLLAAVGLVVAIRRRGGQSWRDDLQEGEEPVEARRHRELRLLVLAGAASPCWPSAPRSTG